MPTSYEKLETLIELRRRGVFSAAQEKAIDALEKRGELEDNIDKIIGSLSQQRIKEQEAKTRRMQEAAGMYRAEQIGTKERLASEPGAFQSTLIGAGKSMFDVGRGLARMTPFYSKEDYAPELATEKEYYGALQEKRPVATTLGEIAGETAAFAPIGGIASSVARTPMLMGKLGKIGTTAQKIAQSRKAAPALTGLASAAETTVSGVGRGESASTISTGAGTSAIVGAAAQMAMPRIFKAAGVVYKRLTGRMPKGSLLTASGLPTPELEEALKQTGTTFEEFSDEAKGLLKGLEPGADPEQAARAALFEEMGYRGKSAPTQAHLRRTATASTQQQEAIKKSGLVRTRIENINKRSEDIFNEAVEEIDPTYKKFDLDTPEDEVVSSTHSHVVGRSRALTNRISEMYKIADEATKGQAVIEPKKTLSMIRQYLGEDRTRKGLPSGMYNALRIREIIDKDGNIIRKITAKEAESLVAEINERLDLSSTPARIYSRKLKDAIDDDVFSQSSSELHKKAREFKAKYHRELEGVGASEFSTRKVSLISDILNDKITEDDLFKKTVLTKASKAQDIRNLKKYLRLGTESERKSGEAAWNKLRAETMQWIKDNSFKGAPGEKETPFITRAKFESALRTIGPHKLREIFEPQEIVMIQKMRKLLKLMEPISGTAQGLGPSAQSVRAGWESVKKLATKVPIFGQMTDDLTLDATNGMLRSRPDVTKRIDQTELTKKIASMATGIAAGKEMKEKIE